MRKPETSKADIEHIAEEILAGAGKNQTDVQKFALDVTELQTAHDQFGVTNSLLIELTGKKEQAAKDLKALKKQLKEITAKCVSVLEGQYGKTNPKLLDYGIEPRIFHPHKGPKQKKA
jgi:hypothetical protein